MKKLIIILLSVLFIISCTHEAAEKLKNSIDDYNISSISALSQVELIYLKMLPVDKEGNIDNTAKFEVINHFDKIEAAYESYKNIFEKLESGYFLAAPTVKKSKKILEKLLKQQVYFYDLLNQPELSMTIDEINAKNLLYSAILKGLLVLELVENYNKFDISVINNIISEYNIKLNNPDFNENLNFIINKIGGSK